ncbi:MAG: 50S ribosomal protein L4 [Parvularculaceae bacterium]
MKLDVVTLAAKKAGTVDLDDAIFGLDPRKDILHRMVTWQLAKRRAGTHKARERNEISGSTRKIVRQKGSGGARHGNRKAPQFRGGGKAHGPRPRDHAFDLPKKLRALALRHALSAKARANALVILDEAKSPEPKTKPLAESFKGLALNNALIVDGAELDANFKLASRNIPNIDVLPIQGINVYDILRRDKLVLTKAAVEKLRERFSAGGEA